ncbi:MAG: LysR family transcriptional regulator [Bdellovibrionota bacterium]
METNRLRQFCILCETQNLRKAAELVNLSHSAFHKSLQVLQGELGVALYKVNGRHIVITPEGKVFLEKAKKFLEAERSFLSFEKTQEDSYRIATHETFSSYLIASNWGKYFENVGLSCRELLPGRIEEAVLSGIVDLGVTYEPIPRAGVDFIKITQVEMRVYALKGAFEKLDFKEIPFVSPIDPLDTLPTGARGLDGWPETLFQRKVLYRVDLLSTAMGLVTSGRCAIFIPDFVANVHNAFSSKKLARIPTPLGMKKVYRNLTLVHREGAGESSELRKIAKMLRVESH